MSPAYTALWPGVGAVLLASAVVCLFAKRWGLGLGLLLPAVLLLGSWQYDRTHETKSVLHVMLLEKRLVKENREHPERSLHHVKVTALEMGNYEGNLLGTDIHLTKPDTKEGTIVVVEIGKHPLTGSYLKSMASQDYGNAPPK